MAGATEYEMGDIDSAYAKIEDDEEQRHSTHPLPSGRSAPDERGDGGDTDDKDRFATTGTDSERASRSDEITYHTFSPPPENPARVPLKRPGNRNSLVRMPSLSGGMHNSVYASLLKRSKTQRLSRYSLAAKYVNDAINGYTIELNPRDNAYLDTLAAVYRSTWWHGLIKALIVCHCLSVLLCQQPTASAFDRPEAFFGLVVTLFYLADVALGVVDQGQKRYWRNKWHWSYVALVTLLFLDAFLRCVSPDTLSWKAHLYGFGCLKPVLLLIKTQVLRDLFRTLVSTFPRIATALWLACVLITSYAAIGVAIFNGDYTDEFQNFNSFWPACLAMMVLLTTENFPGILYPGLQAKPVVASLFFTSYVALGVWLLMSLLTAVLFDYYKQCHAEQVMKRRIAEQESLLMAYSILQDDDRQVLEFDAFRNLMKTVVPEKDEEEVRVMFKLLDVDGNNNIDNEEFCNLGEILNYRITRVQRGSRYSILPRDSWRSYFDWIVFPSSAMFHIVTHKLFIWGIKGIVLINIVQIMCFRTGGVDHIEDIAMDAVSHICLAVYTIEMVLKMRAYGIREYLALNAYDCFLVVFSIIMEMALPRASTCGDSVCYIQLVRSLRVLRVLSIWKNVKHTVWAMSKGSSTMGTLFTFLSIIFYVYACVGVLLFQGVEIRSDSDYDPETFEDFWKALLSLFQIATSNNWNDVMYSLIPDLRHSFFFVSFYVFVCMVILNVLTALVIDTYTSFKDKRGVVEASDDVVYLTSAPYPPRKPIVDDDEEETGTSSPVLTPRVGGLPPPAPGNSQATYKSSTPVMGSRSQSARNLHRQGSAPALLAAQGGQQGGNGMGPSTSDQSLPSIADVPEGREEMSGLESGSYSLFKVAKRQLWSRFVVREEMSELRDQETSKLRKKLKALLKRLNKEEKKKAPQQRPVFTTSSSASSLPGLTPRTDMQPVVKFNDSAALPALPE